MSLGMTPVEFVKQVYYAQEKVVLDFYPTDDKYKEVLYEANLVLQELQKEEDWVWLRTEKILGTTEKDTRFFPVPDNFYKASTLFDDAIRFYAHKPRCSDPMCRNFNYAEGETRSDGLPFSWDDCKCHCFDRAPFIVVPWVPAGWQNDFAQRQMSYITRPNVPDITLGATVMDNGETNLNSLVGRSDKIVFSRPLLYPEIDRVVLLQYQRLLQPFHICTDSCHAVPYQAPDPEHPGQTIESTEISYDPNNWHPCSELVDSNGNLKKALTEVPDPSYVVIRTAQYHAEGSPPAQGRIAGLQDQAQKLLSAMRENNHAATTVDYIPSWNPGFWMVT